MLGRGGRVLLLIAATGCSAAAHKPDGKPEAIPAPDTAGARAFLEEMTALARAAMTAAPLPAGKLPLRPDEGKDLISREHDGPPPTMYRPMFAYANVILGYANEGTLRMTLVLGPTGLRVGEVGFMDYDPPAPPRSPALAGLQSSLASISWALKGGWGTVPWSTDADAAACGPARLCALKTPNEAALAQLADRIADAGLPGG